MEKPKNIYKKGSVIYDIFEGDWADLTPSEIGEILCVDNSYVRSCITRIRKETSYLVPHKMKSEKTRLRIDFGKWRRCHLCSEASCSTCSHYGKEEDHDICKGCKKFGEYTPCNFCSYCGRPLHKISLDGYLANLKDYLEFY